VTNDDPDLQMICHKIAGNCLRVRFHGIACLKVVHSSCMWLYWTRERNEREE